MSAVNFPTGMEFVTVVSPSDAAETIAVAIELQERFPTLSNDQIREKIVHRGVMGFVSDFNLPRAGSNLDEDA